MTAQLSIIVQKMEIIQHIPRISVTLLKTVRTKPNNLKLGLNQKIFPKRNQLPLQKEAQKEDS
jgi:hypothetical protein